MRALFHSGSPQINCIVEVPKFISKAAVLLLEQCLGPTQNTALVSSRLAVREGLEQDVGRHSNSVLTIFSLFFLILQSHSSIKLWGYSRVFTKFFFLTLVFSSVQGHVFGAVQSEILLTSFFLDSVVIELNDFSWCPAAFCFYKGLSFFLLMISLNL
jgi:hypothetical protein